MTAPVARLVHLLAALTGAIVSASTVSAADCGGGCYRHVTAPPVYGAVSERVMVRPAQIVYRTAPPVYETVSERVMVSPGGRIWQTRHDAGGALIGCWVTLPPQYSERRRRVLVQPAEAIPESIPAEYASVQRRVLLSPARSGWVPAQGGYGGYRGYGGNGGNGGYGPVGIGSIPDAFGITGASSADIGVGLGFSRGSIYDGY